MFKFENLYGTQYFPIIFLKKTKPFLFLIKAEAVHKKLKIKVVLQDTFYVKYILILECSNNELLKKVREQCSFT